MSDEVEGEVENEVGPESTGDSATAKLEAMFDTGPGDDTSSAATPSSEPFAEDACDVENDAQALEDDATLEELMRETAPNSDLEDRALAAAAEAAIKEGERALETAARAMAHASGKIDKDAPPTPKKLAGKRLMVLRGLLLFNIVMMGVMIVLPDPPKEPKTDVTKVVIEEPKTEVPVNVPSRIQDEPNRFVAPVRKPTILETNKAVTAALLAGQKGEYHEAVELLLDYLQRNPNINPILRGSVYNPLIYYLRMDGRQDEALKYENEMLRLRGKSSYPRDLLKRARMMEKSGDYFEMRRAYAKLLLTQETIMGPSMRAAVTEAYLKFGDSYRLEAGAAGTNEGHSEQLPRHKSRSSDGKVYLGPSAVKPPPEKKSGGH